LDRRSRIKRPLQWGIIAPPFSVYRYKNYLSHLKDIVPILEPAITRLGYDVD
jgi:hypothetical protein